MDGGGGGIRTHGGLAPTAVFKTAALNHSATLPCGRSMPPDERICKRKMGANDSRNDASEGRRMRAAGPLTARFQSRSGLAPERVLSATLHRKMTAANASG